MSGHIGGNRKSFIAGVVVHQDQDAVFTSYTWLRALLIEARSQVWHLENGAKGNPWIRRLSVALFRPPLPRRAASSYSFPSRARSPNVTRGVAKAPVCPEDFPCDPDPRREHLDPEAWARHASFDPSASRLMSAPFSELAARLEDLRPGVRLLAIRNLGDAEVAEDVAQEVLVRALTAINDGRLRDEERLAGFVRGIARHVIADEHRRNGRKQPLPRRKLQSDQPSPLRLLITQEEREAIREQLSQLPRSDRKLLRLIYFEGLRVVEIAERLGEPAARLRKRKSRALARLREAMTGRGGGSRLETTADSSEEVKQTDPEMTRGSLRE